MVKKTFFVAITLVFLVGFVIGPALGKDAMKIGVVIEMTGAAASLGDYWTKGVNLAVEEINASGGVLGVPIKTEIFDTQSKPPISVSAVKKALSWKVDSISGPIYSSSTLANMSFAQEAKVPQFVGSENWQITKKGNDYIFRTSTQQGFEIPKLLNWVMSERKPKKIVVIYVNNDYGIGGMETAEKYLKEQWNTDLALKLSIEQKQADYSAELNKIKRAGADAVFVYTTEEEAAMFFRQTKRMGVKLLMFAPNSGISEDTLRLAKDAVDGVYGMSNFEYTAPEPNCQRTAKIYKERYGSWPDNEFFKGYNSIYLSKIAYELAGSFDTELMAKKMHDLFITPKMNDKIVGGNLYYDEFGDLHCWDYLTKIVWDGKEAKPKIVGALPPLKGPDSTKKTIYYSD